MSSLTKKYNFYNSVIRRTLFICGLWPVTEPSLFYRSVAYVNTICLFLLLSALLNFCYNHKDNLKHLSQALGLVLSFISNCQKITRFVCYRKKLVKLHNSLATLFNDDFEDSELRPVLLSPLSIFYGPSLILLTILIGGSSVFTCKPIISIITHSVKGIDVEYTSVVPAFYPWKFDASTLTFAIHYVFEAYTNTVLATVSCSVDVLFGYYIFQISAQLRTLSYRMTKLSSKQDYRKVINECVNRHKILARCQADIELIYGPIVLWLSISSAIVLCTLLYQASHTSAKKGLHILLYIMFKAIQTLLYGSFGTRLTIENEMFREAIYASDWPGSGEKCLMNNILIMITFTKPFILKACAVSTISVEMFVAVCNTAISYFLMLRTMEESYGS